MTRIESFLFNDRSEEQRFYLFAGFRYDAEAIKLRIEAGSNQAGTSVRVMQVIFDEARITSIADDEGKRWAWPLEIVSVDCSPSGERWRFVLHCEAAKWAWVSAWPIVIETKGEVSEAC